MSSSSPPKPWETQGTTPNIPTAMPITTAGAPPPLPERNLAMTDPTNTQGGYGAGSSQYGSRYGNNQGGAYGSTSAYGRGGYGSSYGGGGMGGYGSMGGMGGYGSSMGGYGGMGGYGSSMGGYGGMGGGYGGYGGGMGGGYGGMNGGMGMGGMGGGMIGPDGQPMEASIGQRMESAFQVLYSISAFFSSFSQLIDSSFSATHSSFFAMIGVAEQLGMFRHYLGSALNIFEMVRWIRELGNRIIGREPQAGQITAEGFRAFESGSTGSPSSSGQPKKSSRKPLLIFLLTVVGLPWLLTRIASAIANRRLHAAAAPGGAPLPSSAQHPGGPTPLDPSSLLFTRALHPYTAPAGETGELTFVANDIIAILSTEEERSTSSWWLGRTRDGRIGWLPSTYVELLSENKVALSASKQKIKDEEEQARKKTPE